MKVALAGLGNMGVPISERILAAGHELTVWNRSPGKAEPLASAGALPAGSPRELLSDTEVCFTSLANDDALRAVVLGDDGILSDARPGAVLVDTSTVSVEASNEVAGAAAAAGIEYLRAPVSGNPGVVRAGNLTIIVSGPEEAFRQVEGLLREIGQTVYHIGSGEEARVVKLALQIMIAGTAELLSEALVLAEAEGVDRARLLDVIGGSVVGSPFVSYKTGPLLADDYSPTFTTSNMLKDVKLVLELAGESGLELPVTELLRELVADSEASGHGERDFMALYLRLKERSGHPTRSDR